MFGRRENVFRSFSGHFQVIFRSFSGHFQVRMDKDEAFCKRLVEKLQTVFFKIFLPELVSISSDPNNNKGQKLYCICNRPYFAPMIACYHSMCKIIWYHYSYVMVKQAPKGNWVCPECQKTTKKETIK